MVLLFFQKYSRYLTNNIFTAVPFFKTVKYTPREVFSKCYYMCVCKVLKMDDSQNTPLYGIYDKVKALRFKSKYFSPDKKEDLELAIKRTSDNVKPPNILIYGEQILSFINSESNSDRTDTTELFNNLNLKDHIKLLFHKDYYAVYESTCHVLSNPAWIENTALLVMLEMPPTKIQNHIMRYILDGGKLFSSSVFFNKFILENIHKKCNFKKLHTETVIIDKNLEISDCKIWNSNHLKPENHDNIMNIISFLICYSERDGDLHLKLYKSGDQDLSEQDMIIMDIKKGKNKNILNHIISNDLEMKCSDGTNDSNRNLDKTVFLMGDSTEVKISFLNDILENPVLVDGMKLTTTATISCKTSFCSQYNDLLVMDIDSSTKAVKFSYEKYKEYLETATLGKLIMYSDIVTSTMTMLSALPKYKGLTVVASTQTSGVGRSGNQWLSPDGCAMFSFLLSFDRRSNVGQYPSFLQHIISIASIDAVLKMPGYEDLPLKLKWPNDIYYKDKTKIGGVLVNCSMLQNEILCNIGVGINLNNSQPTLCINEIVRAYNERKNTKLDLLSTEQYIAKVLNEMEELIELFNRNGHSELFEKYYKRWLHSSAIIKISSDVGGNEHDEIVKIVGVDEFGYIVTETQDGIKFQVQPNGNTFDLMNNLIKSKV